MTQESDPAAAGEGDAGTPPVGLPPGLLRLIQEWTFDATVGESDEQDSGQDPGRDTGQDAELADLRRWLRSLPVIEQAKGILMAHYLIDADTAAQVLRRWSSRHNVRIRTISQQLTAAAARPRPRPGQRSALDEALATLEGPESGPQ